MNVAVIGGGYAGMAAAVTLARHGIGVTVFESAPALGGRARRVAYRGVNIDNGQHILIGAYRELLRLIRLVHPGLPADRLLLRLPLQIHIPGHLDLKAARLPAPLHLLVGLLRAHGFTTHERWRALAFLRALKRSEFRLPMDISVRTLLRQLGQAGNPARLLWEPLCTAALNTPPEQASAQVFLSVLRDTFSGSRSDSELLLPRIDLTALFPQAALQYVSDHGGSVRLGEAVLAVDRDGSAFRIATKVSTRRFSHVVCAVGPQALAPLAQRITPLQAPLALVKAFAYQPIVTIYLQYPGSLELPFPMLGLSGGMIQWVFDRAALYGQPGLVALVISASGLHNRLTLEQLGVAGHAELSAAIGPLPQPVWQKVISEKSATFSCDVGLVRPRHNTEVPNFYLAGDYTASDYPATLESAVRSGIQCAESILSHSVEVLSSNDALPSGNGAIPSSNRAITASNGAIPSDEGEIPSTNGAIPSGGSAILPSDSAFPSGDGARHD